MLWIGDVGRFHRHQRTNLVELHVPECHSGQEGAATEVGVLGVGNLVDGPVEDVGIDRAPPGRDGSAADGSYRAERSLDEPLDPFAEPPRVEGHPLQHRTHQIGPGRLEREVVKAAPG